MLVVSSVNILVRMSPDGLRILGTITNHNFKRIASVSFDDRNNKLFVGDSATDRIVSMGLNGQNFTEVYMYIYICARICVCVCWCHITKLYRKPFSNVLHHTEQYCQ